MSNKIGTRYEIPYDRSSLTQEQASVIDRIEYGEQMMGNNLKIPFFPNNSGNRGLMAYNQTSQVLNLSKAEPPYISTGYETLFGEKGSSYKVAETDYDILSIIHKFDNNQKMHYYLLVKESDGDIYDIIERVETKHTCEIYGYRMNSDYLDSKTVGERQIKAGDVIALSNAFDEYGLRGGGKNLLCAYIQTEENEEDSIIISEEAAASLEYELVHDITIPINENDTPLNIYGDDFEYKIMPDIGEDIKDGLLMCVRRIVNQEILFSQSNKRLKMPQVPDDKYFVSGKVVDIQVLCNNPDLLKHKYYGQLNKYYNYSYIFSKAIVDNVETILSTNPNARLTYQLDSLYNESKKLIQGEPIISNDKKFSNMLLKITVLETNKCNNVDKMSDRYGGKGEIGRIRTMKEMPRLKDGRRIDVILNPPSIIKRENLGVIIEPTVNMASRLLLNHIRDLYSQNQINSVFEEHHYEVIDMSLSLILDFLKIVSETMYEDLNIEISNMHENFKIKSELYDAKKYLLESILENECIVISVDPYEAMTLEKLKQIKEFMPEIEDQYIYHDIIDSNGETRTVKSVRPVTVGHKYMYVMKQCGKISHASVSLSSTGLKNDNVKSGSKKQYKSPIKETPIRFGEMEIMNLIHFPKAVFGLVTLYSSSPQGRRSIKDLLTTDDIFNFSLSLEDDYNNRNVEILNAYLMAMGLRLRIKESEDHKIKYLFSTDSNLVDITKLDGSDNGLIKFKSYEDISHNDKYKIIEVEGAGHVLVNNKEPEDYGWIKFDFTDK